MKRPHGIERFAAGIALGTAVALGITGCAAAKDVEKKPIPVSQTATPGISEPTVAHESPSQEARLPELSVDVANDDYGTFNTYSVTAASALIDKKLRVGSSREDLVTEEGYTIYVLVSADGTTKLSFESDSLRVEFKKCKNDIDVCDGVDTSEISSSVTYDFVSQRPVDMDVIDKGWIDYFLAKLKGGDYAVFGAYYITNEGTSTGKVDATEQGIHSDSARSGTYINDVTMGALGLPH